MFLRARSFPVPHGFSTREGGVSEGPFASLNLGFSVPDEPARVEENLRRLARAARIAPEELHSVSQVHGDVILEARERAPEGTLPRVSGEADAIFTARRGAAVGVKTADCVPVLIADPVGRRVMAVHSGWRGTDLEIPARAVEKLVALGGDRAQLGVAIGPCIRACCYEVSPELAGRFSAKFGREVVLDGPARGAGGPRLDLVRAIRLGLERIGVREDQVEVLDACTSCDRERFYSHRRDRGVSGRHFNFVQCEF